MSAPRIRYHLNVRAMVILGVISLAVTAGLYLFWGYQENRVLGSALDQVKEFRKDGGAANDRERKARDYDLALRHLVQYLEFRPNDPEGLELEARLRMGADDSPRTALLLQKGRLGEWAQRLREAGASDLRGAALAYEHLLRVEPASARARRAHASLAAIYILISDSYRFSELAKRMPLEVSKEYRYSVAEVHARQLLDEDSAAKPARDPADEAMAHRLHAMALEGQIVRGQRGRIVSVAVQGAKANDRWEVPLGEGAILEYENVLQEIKSDYVAATRLAGLYQTASPKTADACAALLDNLIKAHPGYKIPEPLAKLRKDHPEAKDFAGLPDKARKSPDIRKSLAGLLSKHRASARLADLYLADPYLPDPYQGSRKPPAIARDVLDGLLEDTLKAFKEDRLDVRDLVDVRTARFAFFSGIGDSQAASAELEEAILLDPDDLPLLLKATELAMRPSSAGRFEPHFWLDQVAEAEPAYNGYDLRLMSSANGISGVPTAGKRLVILAVVDQVLHFRVFDRDGRMVADTDEKRLAEQTRQIDDLRKQLEGLWPPHELTESEQARVIEAVTSIVGRTQRNDPRFLTMKGMVEYSEQKYEAAMETWRKGLDLTNNTDVGLTQRLAVLLLELGRNDTARRQAAAEMVDQYRRLVKENDPVLRFLEGIQDEQEGRLSRAIEHLEWARSRLPESQTQTEISVMLGRCQERQGDIAAAERTYRAALASDPSSLALRQALAGLLLTTRPEEAARELDQALEVSPNQPAFLLDLARAKLQKQRMLPPEQRDWTDFDAAFQRAATADPSSFALRVMLKSERLEAAGELDQAIRLLRDEFTKLRAEVSKLREEIANARKTPRNPEQEDQSKRQSAELELSINRLAELTCRLAEYLLRQRRMDEALAILNQASEPTAVGDRGSLRVERAQVLNSLGQGQEARKTLLRDVNSPALSSADQNLIWTYLYLLCQRQGDPETTRAVYNEWARLLPNDRRPNLALLEMDIEANDQEAIRTRLEALRPPNDQGDFMWRLVQARQKFMEARKVSDEYDLRLMSSANDMSRVPTAGKRLVILAVVDQVLHFRVFDRDGQMAVDTDEKRLAEQSRQDEKRLAEQSRQIDDLRKQLEGLWPSHKLTESEKARVIEAVTSIVGPIPSDEKNRLALLKDAEGQVEKLLRDFKADPVALLLKGMILEAEGAAEKAAEWYDRAYIHGNFDALKRLIYLWARLGRRQELDRLRQNDKTKQLDQLVARAFLDNRNTAEAGRIAEQSLAEEPGRPSWQVGILEAVGRDEDAEAGLRRIAEHQPEKLELWLALARFQVSPHRTPLTSATDRRQQIQGILEAITPLVKDRWPDELLQAECRFAAADWPAADRAFDTALKRHPNNPLVKEAAARYRAHREQADAADACLRRLRAEANIARFKPRLETRWPDELLQAECHFAAADWPAADQAFDTALKRHPDNPLVKKAAERYRAQKGHTDAAETRQRQLAAEAAIAAEIEPHLKTHWPDELLQAECRFAAEDWPAADQAFDTALKRHPNNPLVKEADARYRAQKGRPDAAEAVLRHLKAEGTLAEIKQHVKSPWPELLEAECRWTIADWPAADQAFKAAVERYPNARDVQARAARYYEQRGRLDLAVECLERIVHQNPGERNSVRVLAVVLSNQGNWKQALELLGPEGPGTKTPEGYDLRLMSSANGISGVPTAGKSLVILAVVDQVLHFRVFDRDGRMVADTDEKRLAEQTRQIDDLRKQLEGLRPPHELTESEKARVIEAVTSIVGHTPPEERLARAIVLGQSKDLTHMKQAIDLLQALVADLPADGPVAATARDLLIQNLVRAGQADQASKVAGVAAARGNNPAAIVLFAETLLQSRQFDAAEEQVKRIEQIDPQNGSIPNLRGRLILGRNAKPEEAAAALESAYHARENSSTAEQFAREFFPMMLDLGPKAFEVAERFGRHLAQRNPALSWMTASILARRGEREAALALCRKAIEAETQPADLSKSCRLALDIVVNSPRQAMTLQHASEILDAALKRSPTDDELRVIQAMINHFQERYDEEVRQYRIVLANEPRNPVVLNNLAWALSEGVHQPSEALEKTDELIRLEGRTPNNVDTRGVILMRLGRHDQAVEELTWVVQSEPTGVHYFHLAQAYKKMGRDTDFRKALEAAKRAGLTPAALDPTERAEFENLTNP